MRKSSPPKVVVFAGANGSGKSTLAEALLPTEKIDEFLNADEMARGLSPFNPESQHIAAGRLLLERADSLIKIKKSFAIETTLSGKTLASILQRAKMEGFKIEMYYFYTEDVRINLERIKNRVAQGGHNIAKTDVKRRFYRSVHNLFNTFISLCDTVIVVSTQLGFPTIVSYISGGKAFTANQTAWDKMKKDAQKVK